MRTSAAEVKQIIETSQEDVIVEAYIASASLFVDDTLGSSTLSEATLENIEMWLSAHLLAVTRERVAKEEGAGGAFIKYAGNYDTAGLKSTQYGQMAIMLDTTGTLTNIANSKMTASIKAVTSFN